MYRNISAFSSNGEYFAYSSPDGCLKIWETSTNLLKQEYTPSAHLSATCSSLSWAPWKQNTHTRKKSKQSSSDESSTISGLQLIAMGTMTGDILLYSFTSSELHTCLINGHSSTVNGVCWNTASSLLFSCSNDQQIIVWDVCTGKTKMKWKADKTAIHSVCIIDDNNILSSGSSIQWWNIEQKAVMMSFSGHATEIFRLISLRADHSKKPSYALSAAIGDRVINAWDLEDRKSQSAVASFVLPDQPCSIDVVSKKDKSMVMSAVSKDGAFSLFQHLLNGKVKKPLHPKFTIQIASKGNNDSAKPQAVPILSAYIKDGLDSCLLVYGSFMKPVFERINIEDVCKDLFIIRDLSSSSVSVQDSVSKVKNVEKPSSVKLLAPGYMTQPSSASDCVSRKRKKDVNIMDLPMEERLKALDLGKVPSLTEDKEPAIKSNSMVNLLLQALQSKDNNMLNTVLQNGDEELIYNTVEKMPLSAISLVFQELYIRLTKHQPRNHAITKWLNVLLSVHLQYLVSCKGTDEFIAPISQLIEASAENFSKLSQLRGCLKILMSQASTAAPSTTGCSSEPLLHYESESSENDSGEEEDSVNSSEQIDEDNSSVEESETSKSSDSEMETR